MCNKTFRLQTFDHEAFQLKITTMIDHHLPTQAFTITELDQPWITKELKSLKRIRSREYCHHGKSDKYLELKNKFLVKKDLAVEHYTKKNYQ